MNGVYLQLHSYMLRIAIPYGVLNRRQVRKLAELARNYDRGYGHFTTRQNFQFHRPALKDVPDMPAEARERGNARDPDLGQLHSQRDCGSFRRRRAR